MILTPIDIDELPRIFAVLSRHVGADAPAQAALRRVADSAQRIPHGVDTPEHRAAAIALAARLGIPTIDEEPAAAFSWDGRAIRTRSEASVVIHEVAHWQLCPPERRPLYDFGLGAGPETGRRDEAEAARCVPEEERQIEESLSSLLGVLWEAELSQPAILAFMEQNWLEGWERPSCAANFVWMLNRLREGGFVDDDGRPSPAQGWRAA